MQAQYGIKPGYKPNLVRPPLDEEGAEQYWDSSRVASTRRRMYQYHVYLEARRMARALPGARVLDLGAGPGIKAQALLAPAADVTVADRPSVEPVARKWAPDCRFVGVDLEAAEGRDLGQFDLVVCADVLEHLVDPAPALDLIRRSILDGGRAILSTPERDALRGADAMACLKPEHVREWNAREFRDWVEGSGMTVLDQFTTPQRKLVPGLNLLARLQASLRPRSWRTCQVLVCTLGGRGS